MAKNKMKCSRTVPNDRIITDLKYKTSILNKLIEENTAIPLDKQPDILREIFPENILQNLFRILNIKDKKRELDAEIPTPEISVEDVGENMSRSVGRVNPYLNFFKRTENVDIWNEKPEQEFINLNARSDAKVERITTDFLKWMNGLVNEEIAPISKVELLKGKSTKIEEIIFQRKTLSYSEFRNLFEVVSTSEVATSLQVSIKELQVIPNYVASVRKFPQRRKLYVLKKELQRDSLIAKKTRNPQCDSRPLPQKLKTICKPARIKFTPNESQKRLMSAATMLSGLDKLMITEKYLNYLVNKVPLKRLSKHFQEQTQLLQYIAGVNY